MSIADKLLYLYETKEAIKEALANKGASLGGATFREYASAIDGLLIESDENKARLNYYEGMYYGTLSGDIVIPDFVTKLSNYAFQENNNITSVYIPDTITEFGKYIFSYCDNISSLRLPNHVTVLPEYFLYWSESPSKIPQSTWNNIVEVERGAFYYSNLNTLSGFTSLEVVGTSAFYGCDFTVVNLPNIRIIGEQAFSSNPYLNTVNIGDKIESIAVASSSYNRVFYSCSKLTKINIDKPFGSLEVPSHHWGATNSTIYWNDGVQTPPNESVSKVL